MYYLQSPWKVRFSFVFPFFQPRLYHLQDGFIKGRSCNTNLAISAFAFAKAHERKQLYAVFLDYSKAFDSVSFNCLYGVGIRRNLLSWHWSWQITVIWQLWMARHLFCYLFHSLCLRSLSWDPCCLWYTTCINSAQSVTDAKTTVQLYADDMKGYW